MFIILAFYFNLLFSNERFLVAPTKMEVNLSRATASSYIVTNTGTERLRITASPIYIPIKEFKDLTPVAIVNDDISKSIMLSPKTVSLKPGESRTIRVLIKPKKLPEGEYRANILFKTIPIRHLKDNKKSKKIAIKLGFKLELAPVIYARIGKPKPKLSYNCFVKDKKYCIEVVNKGNARFDGWANLYSTSSKYLSKTKVLLYRETKTTSCFKEKFDRVSTYRVVFSSLKDNKKVLQGTCKFKK